MDLDRDGFLLFNYNDDDDDDDGVRLHDGVVFLDDECHQGVFDVLVDFDGG